MTQYWTNWQQTWSVWSHSARERRQEVSLEGIVSDPNFFLDHCCIAVYEHVGVCVYVCFRLNKIINGDWVNIVFPYIGCQNSRVECVPVVKTERQGKSNSVKHPICNYCNSQPCARVDLLKRSSLYSLCLWT